MDFKIWKFLNVNLKLSVHDKCIILDKLESDDIQESAEYSIKKSMGVI